MNQVAGNRFWMTAKTLVPDTGLGRWVLVVGFVLALAGDIALGSPWFVAVMGLYCGMSVGHVACLFKKSERRRMVPGINETCAAVAIAIVFGYWIFNSVFAICLGHSSPETYGLMLLIIALGIWIGWGERRVFYAFGFLFLVTITLLSTPGPVAVYDWYRDLAMQSRGLIGFGFWFVGCCILWRFWSLMSSNIDSRTFKRKDYLDFLESTALAEAGPAVSQPASVPKSFSTRATWILYGKPYLTRFHYYWGLFSVLFVLSILIFTRGSQELSSAFSSFATVTFILIPAMLFMIRVPQSMGRLWLAGVKESRNATAKFLVRLAIQRAIPPYLLAAVLLLVHAPISFTWYVAICLMLLTGTCLAGIALWIASKGYSFWMGSQTLVGFLTMVFLFGALGGMIPVCTSVVPTICTWIEGYEIPALVCALLANALVWTGCVIDASKTVGQSKAIMECQTASNPVESLNAF